MAEHTGKHNNDGSKVPNWLKNNKSDKDDSAKQEEEVVPHTPKKKDEPVWRYSLKEDGQIYRINAPTTDKMVEKVKAQLTNPNHWRRYARSPHGGDRNYTQLTCFPPFDTLRVAEVFFPDGTVWNSRQRKYIKPEEE